MTGNVGTEDIFDTATVLRYYQRLSGGDNGLSADQMMGEWKVGLCGGPHKIVDEMAIVPTDHAAMALGQHLFGGSWFTLGIPDAWLRNPQPGGTWDAGAGVQANPSNGHAVHLNGWDGSGYKLQTWGFNPPVRITDAGVAICDPEAGVVFSMDWFDGNGRAPNGFTYDQLAAFWVQLGGHALPPSPFTPPPGPTPTPPPVPPAPVVHPLFSLGIPKPVPQGARVTFRAPVNLSAGILDVFAHTARLEVGEVVPNCHTAEIEKAP